VVGGGGWGVQVLNDQIYVYGGHAQPLSNEVWTLKLPTDFFL
jgi:hypothetical protein